MASNDGVPHDLVGMFDGIEEGESVIEVAGRGDGAEVDELALWRRR